MMNYSIIICYSLHIPRLAVSAKEGIYSGNKAVIDKLRQMANFGFK